MKTLKKITDFFLYDGGYESGNDLLDAMEIRRATVMINFSFAVAVLAMVMFISRYSMEGMEKSKTLYFLPIGATYCILSPFLIKYFNKTSWVLYSQLFLGTFIIFFRTISTGGIHSPVVLWFSIIPMVSSLASIRTGIIWSIISLVSVLTILYADHLGIPVNHIRPTDAVNAVVILVLLVLMASLSIIFEAKRDENEKLIREKEKELARAKKLASLGNLSGGIAHEINNPLAIVLGRLNIVEKLKKRGELKEENLDQSLESIHKNLSRIRAIVDALRTFSKDNYMTEFEIFDLNETINNVLESLNDNGLCQVVTIENNIPKGDVLINGNAPLLERVFSNLIKNSAYEINGKENPWIKIEIGRERDGFYVINVTDSGNTISKEAADKIMDPFFTTKEVGEGTGLGLSLSQNILALHQGYLKINTDCPNAQFQIFIPKFIEQKVA